MDELRVIKEASTIEAGTRSGLVVVECATADPHTANHLLTMSSKYGPLAVNFAAERGLHGAAIDPRQTAPYPVNSAGENIFLLATPDGQPLPASDPRNRVAAYRLDVRLTAA